LGGVDATWLMWWINTPPFRRRIVALQAGTTRKRISRKNLASIEFAVPPLGEQRRIVASIDEQFSRLSAADYSLQRADQRLHQFRAAVLAEAVSGGWPVEPLSNIALSLRNGVFVSRPAREPPGTAIFRISAVRPMALDVEDVRYTSLSEADANGAFVDEGDLLFTRYSGNPEYVGACACVRSLPRPTLHPDKLIRVVLNQERVDPAFVELACATGMTLQAIRARRKTTAGQVGIAGGQLKTIPVPVPPLAEQRRIVAHVRQRISVIDAQRNSIEVAKRRSASLRRSILDRAFRGELVPQNPADEAAAELLERTRQVRGTTPRRLKRRRVGA